MEKIYKIGIDARLWNETGVGRYIRNLVSELQVLDKKNKYILFGLSKDIDQVKSQITNPKFQLKVADIRWHTVKEQVKFGKILEKENLDLMHFPYFSLPVFYTKPFVVTIHDLILHHFPTGKASTLPLPLYYFKQIGYRWVVKQAAQKAKKVIAVSEATKSQIVKDLHIPEGKIIVTYEGVSQGLMMKDKGSKTTNNKLLDTNYFLYVGNAYPHKNLERLVEAFQSVKREALSGKDIKLILVGKEDYFYKRLKEKVQQLDFAQEIIFKHSVSDEELSGLYQHAQALFLPSLMEGFGLTGLEALAQKCLVVASDIPSLKEMYKDGAVYIDPLSVESLVQSMIQVYSMSNEDKELYGKKGLALVKNFSWTKMAAQTLEVYESCIGL